MASSPDLLLIVLFFLIALFYSSIGFGGGSSYLALLSLFFADFQLIRTTALLCNVAVVLGSVLLFYRKGLMDWKRFLPIVAVSVPAAFVGAQFRLDEGVFFILLGLALIASSLMLFLKISSGKKSDQKHYTPGISLSLGGGIGLLSGLVGIGGGIFLSPVLNLLQWDNARKIAALASFFILANSLAGIGGLLLSDHFQVKLPLLLFLLLVVIAGGQIGSRLTLSMLKPRLIKILTACLGFYVGLRLVLSYLFDLNI